MIAIGAYVVKELAAQHGIQTEEVVQQRMHRVQQNINEMQKRIDNIIEKEVKSSMETIGHALHIHGASPTLHGSSSKPSEHLDENNTNISNNENLCDIDERGDDPPTYNNDIESFQEDSYASYASTSQQPRRKSLHRLATSSYSSTS